MYSSSKADSGCNYLKIIKFKKMNNTNHYKQDIQPPNKLPSIIMKGTNGGTNGSGTQGVCPYMQ